MKSWCHARQLRPLHCFASGLCLAPGSSSHRAAQHTCMLGHSICVFGCPRVASMLTESFLEHCGGGVVRVSSGLSSIPLQSTRGILCLVFLSTSFIPTVTLLWITQPQSQKRESDTERERDTRANSLTLSDAFKCYTSRSSNTSLVKAIVFVLTSPPKLRQRDNAPRCSAACYYSRNNNPQKQTSDLSTMLCAESRMCTAFCGAFGSHS